jgi:superfamily II DNA or RNA helicase
MSRGNNQFLEGIKYRIKGWLPPEKFRELLRFSDYLGREDGESVFKINPYKAKRNEITLEEITEILQSLGDLVSQTTIRVLEEKKTGTLKAIIRMEGGDIELKPIGYLGEYTAHLKKYMKYDRSRRVFKVHPGLLHELLEKLNNIGITVEDRTGLPPSLPLTDKITFTGKLRDYQEEALEKWRENRHRGIIALPTGSGKTIIGVAAIAELSERTLIITYTKEQLRQWIQQIEKNTDTPKSYVSPFYSEEKRLSPITVSTYQTAFRHIRELAYRYSLLIVDEVHHLPAEKFKRIALGLYSPHRMGLSATVIREDGKHTELFPLMGGIVYHKTPQEMVEKGYLAPFITRIIKVELTPDERKEYEKLRNIYRALSMGLPFNEVLKRAQKGDPRMGRALSIHSSMQQVFQKASAKEKAVKDLVQKELAENAKILVFTQYVEQAKKLGEILEAPVLTGEMDIRERSHVLDEFRNAEKGVLVLTTVGDEGLDIPDVNVGIIVAGTGSRRQYVQRLGRLLRPRPGKTAKLYEIIVKGTAEEFQARRRRKLREKSGGKEDKGQTTLF